MRTTVPIHRQLTGNLKPLANGRLALVERNLDLAAAVASMERRRIPERIETQDLRQVASLALCEQAQRFDYRGARDVDRLFRCYAFPRIRGQLRELNRRREFRNNDAEALEVDERVEDGDGEDRVLRSKMRELAHELIAVLPLRFQLVVRHYYFGGLTLERVGLMLRPRLRAPRVCALLHEAHGLMLAEAKRKGYGAELLR